ncbi:MAG: AAA family ATPase [Bacteroidales bacterium]|nr:AAA family ATPase [Bacteroidales bacterium]
MSDKNFMLPLRHFKFPTLEELEVDDAKSLFYPGSVVMSKQISTMDFAPITILYGNNGSGKSTILNIIGRRIKANGALDGTSSRYMDYFVERCNAHGLWRESLGSINFYRSEVIAKKVIDQRKAYDQIRREIRNFSDTTGKDIYERIYHTAPHKSEYEGLNAFEISQLNKLQYPQGLPDMWSNGETALQFYRNHIEPLNLYLLDEPENSLSPVFQKELVQIIERAAYTMDCQFVIATHSPFMLAMDRALIYDLDTIPVKPTKDWTTLRNMQIQFALFHRFAIRFEKHISSVTTPKECL